ncbi:MAG: hypothetical protein KO206_03705 [Methanomicrobiaceae archaeon]|nr:hypothetical protein [Methanomicrobiaceae archaeon]
MNRDKGYFGVKPQASMGRAMYRAVRGHPLSIKEKRRNTAIGRTRSLVKRPSAMLERTFEAGHLMATTVARVHATSTFACMSFNLRQHLIRKAQAAGRRLSK